MNKLNAILATAFTLVSLSAHADRTFTCTSTAVKQTENLIVKGAGQDAQVHLEDDSISGDYTFNAWFNGQASDDDTIAGTPDYLDLGFLGLVQDKSNPTEAKYPAGFFISPEVLSGQNGTINLWTGNAATDFNCI